MTVSTYVERHHGIVVYVSNRLEKLRKTDCLCLNCVKMDRCPIAKKLFGLCVRHNLALGVSRCRVFRQKDECPACEPISRLLGG